MRMTELDTEWMDTEMASGGQGAWLPGCFGARLRLPLVGSLPLWTPAVCCSGSATSFSSKWSSSLSSVVSSVCVACVRSNSPFKPSVSNSCWAYTHHREPLTSRHHNMIPGIMSSSSGLPSSFWNGTLIHSLKPHLWCCRTPSAFPPLSHRSYPMGQRGQTSRPRTPAAGVHPHPSPGASLLRYRLLVSLLVFCPGFVLSNNKNSSEVEYIHTPSQTKK